MAIPIMARTLASEADRSGLWVVMSRYFDPRLVNDPFGDPGLYVDLVFQKRAILFDIGDLSPLAPRKLLRLSDVFVSHLHMDHFVGFDQLLRCILGRDKSLSFYGPTGLIAAVEHKLKAYTWNLIGGYEGNPTLHVTECDVAGNVATARFCGRRAFSRVDMKEGAAGTGGLLIEEPGFEVRAVTLDHGIPVLAFALKERAHINIWRDRVEAMGLTVGPWLGEFKAAVVHGSPEDTPINVVWRELRDGRPTSLPLGSLKKEIMRVTAGRKIAYVVDCAFTAANAERIIALAEAADILFIETPFLHEDKVRAAARSHLTARQAGTLARLASVKRVETMHYSPRYHACGDRLAREAKEAFLRG